jgi:hypothetical protein
MPLAVARCTSDHSDKLFSARPTWPQVFHKHLGNPGGGEMRNTSWPRPCHIARVDRVQVDAKPPYNPRMPIHTGSGLLWSSSAVLPQQINCLSRAHAGRYNQPSRLDRFIVLAKTSFCTKITDISSCRQANSPLCQGEYEN